MSYDTWKTTEPDSVCPDCRVLACRCLDDEEKEPAMSDKKTLNDFWDCYELLAEQGACDAPGGAEYKRVELEWQQAGRPSDIEAFIRSRANAL